MDSNLKRITPSARKYMYMLAGLGFLAMGAVGLLIGRRDSGAIAGSGVFALCGAIFMCVRFGVIVDRQRRTVTKWWGLLVPFRKTEHPFSQAHFVTLSHERRHLYRSASYEVFPVRLEGAGADAITLHEPRDYDKARRLAEEIAKFLHLGIRDRSSGEEVVRDAGTLNESIRQRAKRLGLTSRMPQQLPGARSSVSFGESRLTATIDMPVMHWVWVVLAGLMIAGLSAVFIEFDPKLHKYLPDMGRPLFTFLVLLCLILPIFLFVAPRDERLVVSPDELVLTRRGVFGSNTIRLQANEIEEVEITRMNFELLVGSSIVVRSDRGSVEFGAERSEKELKWLRDVVIHVLTSASP